uniref:Secreted protein n=1 Tax=Anopheles darlingi TaxID=43151 RepID=A0A2M4DJK9_ANODA
MLLLFAVLEAAAAAAAVAAACACCAARISCTFAQSSSYLARMAGIIWFTVLSSFPSVLFERFSSHRMRIFFSLSCKDCRLIERCASRYRNTTFRVLFEPEPP